MKLCEIPLHKLAIGQVVAFGEGKFGFICEIVAEVKRPRSDVQKESEGWYSFPRYTRITFFSSTGRVTMSGFHMSSSEIVLNRVLEEREFFHFEEIAKRESANWKPLEA